MPPASFSPAAERNKQPIVDVLRRVLPASGCALEIASGTGQHVAWFASAMPGWTWQPTDGDAASLPAIAQWTAHAGTANVHPPIQLDVMSANWPSTDAPFTEVFDAIYCANMIHISPWSTCAALMQGSARHLAPHGLLVLYGPFLEDDVPTAPGNVAFDESLRTRNPAWGIRRLEDVASAAAHAGLAVTQRHAMPANNLLIVLARQALMSKSSHHNSA
jgi:hypothetical protein